MGAETTTKPGTKDALIKAALTLFADKGFDRVSLRDITGLAGANVASVKYHFGSRENLIDAAISEIITPVNRERLALLDDLEARGSFTVPDLLAALFNPLFRQINSSPLGERLFCKLMGRIVGDRPYEFDPEIMVQFRGIAERFTRAFQKILPNLSQEEVLWRLHFSFGVLSTTLLHGELFKKISEEVLGEEDLETTFSRILNFCSAGFLK